jgi:hypothetical protein
MDAVDGRGRESDLVQSRRDLAAGVRRTGVDERHTVVVAPEVRLKAPEVGMRAPEEQALQVAGQILDTHARQTTQRDASSVLQREDLGTDCRIGRWPIDALMSQG